MLTWCLFDIVQHCGVENNNYAKWSDVDAMVYNNDVSTMWMWYVSAQWRNGVESKLHNINEQC